MTHPNQLSEFSLLLLLMLLPSIRAYDSPHGTATIPPHDRAWIETRKPDIDTVLLWKFSPEGAEETIEEDELEEDLFAEGEGADEDDAELARLPGANDAVMPRLKGGVKIGKAGRFGGGLILNGTGQANAEGLNLKSILLGDKGLTLDMWVRPAGGPGAKKPQRILSIPSIDGKDALGLSLESGGRIAAVWRGEKKLVHSERCPADRWTHLALTLTTTGASRKIRLDLQMVWTSLRLDVNGISTKADRPLWLNGDTEDRQVARRRCFGKTAGSKVVIGSGVVAAGFRGTVDEVRLRRRPRFFYSWDFGWQEAAADKVPRPMDNEYFKPGKVLTRFRFDGNLRPDVFAGFGLTGEDSADKSHFVQGIKGRGLDLSKVDETSFSMRGYRALPETGSVEFWLRPKDWHNFYQGEYHGTDVKHLRLMNLIYEKALHNAATKNIEIFKGRSGQVGKVQWDKIHPGTWTHVLFSINKDRSTAYVNGRKQKLRQVGLVTRGHPHSRNAHKAWLELTGGKEDGSYRLTFVPSPTVIDELSIYSWDMDANEAWNAYARWMPQDRVAMKVLPAFGLTFDYFAHSWSMKERLVMKLACLAVNGVKPARADLEIRDQDGQPVHLAKGLELDETGQVTVTVSKALSFGTYSVMVRSYSKANEILKQKALMWERERPAWLENTLGKERTVPKPWSPIRVEGPKLQTWGRNIALGDNGLPQQIKTLGREILARPVAMSWRVAGKDARAKPSGLSFTEKAEDRVAWQASLTGGGLRATVNAWMEFDGLIYTDVELRPEEDELEIQELKIEVPIRKDAATQFIANGGGGNFRASVIYREIPADKPWAWNSAEQPYPGFQRALRGGNYLPQIWIGNDQVGLNFCGENDSGWTVDEKLPAQEILPGDSTVIYRMNIIARPVKIGAEGRRFHFILLPTPAKPEPVGWRGDCNIGGVTFGSVATFGGFNMKADPRDPLPNDSFRVEPRSWEHATEMSRQCRGKWGQTFLYTDASWPRPGPGFKDWDHDLWAGAGRIAWTPEFEDYFVWAVNEYLRRDLIDGVYIDDVSVGRTLSLASTAYEFPGNKNGRRQGFTVMAQRRALQRLWRLFQAKGMKPQIWLHMTYCYELPMFSFARYLLNGEIFSGIKPWGKRDVMDCWSPTALRILGGSAKWGAGMEFKSILDSLDTVPLPRLAEAKYPHSRAQTAAFVTSDSGLGQGLAQSLVLKLKPTGFFSPDIKVTPWWKVSRLLDIRSPEGSRLTAAVYALPDRAFVFISNHDRKANEVSLSIKPGTLFPGQARIVWRDLDPGLKPPTSTIASQEDIANATKPLETEATLDQEDEVTEETLLNDLEGTTQEDRELAGLALKTKGNAAQVVIRPRDYRILEAKPVR